MIWLNHNVRKCDHVFWPKLSVHPICIWLSLHIAFFTSPLVSKPRINQMKFPNEACYRWYSRIRNCSLGPRHIVTGKTSAFLIPLCGPRLDVTPSVSSESAGEPKPANCVQVSRGKGGLGSPVAFLPRVAFLHSTPLASVQTYFLSFFLNTIHINSTAKSACAHASDTLAGPCSHATLRFLHHNDHPQQGV